MIGALLGLAGMFVGLVVPRLRWLALTALATVLPLAAFLALALGAFPSSEAVSIRLGALALGGGLFVAVMLARLVPRAFVFLLLVALVSSLQLWTLQPRALQIGAAVLALVLALVVLLNLDVAMRVACAGLGARLVVAAIPGLQDRLWWLPITAVLLLGSGLRRGADPPPWPWAKVRLGGVLLGGAAALALLLLPALAQELPAPAGGAQAARLAKLRAAAPQGGLIWPLPSEAIAWDPPYSREAFPAVDNLDALWLSGYGGSALRKLPGTGLSGRLGLHRNIATLREIKDKAELDELRFAARATVESLREALPLFRAGAREAELGQKLIEGFGRHGCAPESFPPIVASGPSAAAAHGSGNQGVLKQGELVVIDIGCYRNHYASDFTRTLPVGGRFSERQRALYQAVYDAQQEALRACKPGVSLNGRIGRAGDSMDAKSRGLIKARGFTDHNLFSLGHTVGLFVHDVASPGPLKAGMVITIEPGIYLDGELGIRVEDTYLVTATGCESLTEGFPASPAEVEAALAGAHAGP